MSVDLELATFKEIADELGRRCPHGALMALTQEVPLKNINEPGKVSVGAKILHRGGWIPALGLATFAKAYFSDMNDGEDYIDPEGDTDDDEKDSDNDD